MTGVAGRPARRAFPWRAVLLGIILALHFVSRFEAHQTTPLRVRHFYPTSYFVSLSLIAGRGFNYLLPADTSPTTGAWTASVGSLRGSARRQPRRRRGGLPAALGSS